MTLALATAFVPLLFLGASWLSSEQQPVRAAERLLAEGKAEAAVQQLGQALADNPDSAVIAYNLGNAHYRAKQYEAAVQAYRRVRVEKAGTELSAHAAYNAGNALFRLGESAEPERPQDALSKYTEALVEYRRALALAPTDSDAKFNYEYTTKKLEDLRKRLEELAKQHPTPEQPDQALAPTPTPQSQRASGEQPQSSEEGERSSTQDAAEKGETDSSASGHEQATEEESPEQEDAASPRMEDQPSASDSSASTGEPVASSAAEPNERREARALIDTARQEELSPTEFWREQHHGVVAEPAQDW